MSGYYTAKDIKKILGLKADKLLYWVRLGLVKPAIIGRGRGTVNKFTLKELLILKEIQVYRKLGYTMIRIEELITGMNLR